MRHDMGGRQDLKDVVCSLKISKLKTFRRNLILNSPALLRESRGAVAPSAFARARDE